MQESLRIELSDNQFFPLFPMIDILSYQCILNFEKETNPIPKSSIPIPGIFLPPLSSIHNPNDQPPLISLVPSSDIYSLNQKALPKMENKIRKSQNLETLDLRVWKSKLYRAINWKKIHQREPIYSQDLEGEVYLFFLNNEIEYKLGRMKNPKIRELWEKHVILCNPIIDDFSMFETKPYYLVELPEISFNDVQNATRHPSSAPNHGTYKSESKLLNNKYDNLNSCTLGQLKNMARDLGISGFSKYRSSNKHELIQILREKKAKNMDRLKPVSGSVDIFIHEDSGLLYKNHGDVQVVCGQMRDNKIGQLDEKAIEIAKEMKIPYLFNGKIEYP